MAAAERYQVGSRVTAVIAFRDAKPAAALAATLRESGIEVNALCTRAPEVLPAVATHRPDVTLIDSEIDSVGLDVAMQVAEHQVFTRVILMSPRPRQSEMLTAVRAGVQGYLRRSTARHRLPAIVVGVAGGEAALSKRDTSKVMAELARADRVAMVEMDGHGCEPITDHEAEVGRCLGSGLSTKEVAVRLGLAESTVQRVRASLRRKLEARDRAQTLELADGLGRASVLLRSAGLPGPGRFPTEP